MQNFTHFKTTNNRLGSQPLYKTCRKLLLTTELSNHKSDLYIFYKTMKFTRNNKFFEISSDDLNSMCMDIITRKLKKQIIRSYARS